VENDAARLRRRRRGEDAEHRRGIVRHRGAQFVVGVGQQLRYHRRPGNDGHEVRVALPAGYDMPVQMLRDARARHRAEIEAKIEAVAAERRSQDARQPGEQEADFGHLAIVERVERRDLPIRDDHAVAGVVGVKVHHDKGARAAIQDEVLRVVFRIGGNRAEDAHAGRRRAALPADIVHAPRRPEPLLLVPVRPTHAVTYRFPTARRTYSSPEYSTRAAGEGGRDSTNLGASVLS